MNIKTIFISLYFFISTATQAGDYFNYVTTKNGGIQILINKKTSFFCDELTLQQEKDRLINEPFAAMELYVNYLEPLVKELNQHHKILKEANQTSNEELLLRYQEETKICHKHALEIFNQSPLCLLRECRDTEDECCALSRDENPSDCPRKSFEDEMLSALENKDNLNVLFYASGHCYFETRLLFLMNKDIQSVVFIDPYYKNGIDFLTQKQIGLASSAVCENAQALQREFIYLAAQIAQALSRYNKKLSLFFYKNHQDYLNDKSNQKLDLICAIDYQENHLELNINLENELNNLEKNMLSEDGVMATSFCFRDGNVCSIVREKELY